MFISESSFQKSGSRCSKEDSVQIPRIVQGCIRPDVMATRSDANQSLTRNRIFRHKYGKTAASVRTIGQHRSDVVLIMVITCSRSATVWTLGQHHPDAALILY
jgi:hypothetical protein